MPGPTTQLITQMHVVFKDAKSGNMVTGYDEQVGLLAGAVVRVPK